MFRTHVYRPPPTTRPQYYRARAFEPYTLRWLYNRATQQIFTASIPGTLSTESLFYGQSPPVATGDLCVIPLVTPEGGFAITATADGVLSIAGDGSSTRQTVPFDIYDISLSAFYGGATAYINNQAPVFTGSNVVYAIERNQTITPIDISGLWSDPEGDGVTFTKVTAMVGSVDVSVDGVIAGITPDANSVNTVTFRATDIAGDFGDGDITLLVGNVTVPNVRSQSQTDATLNLNTGYLSVALGTAVFSSLAVGLVVSQTPAEGNEVAPFSTVTIVLSLGSTGIVTVLGQVNDRTAVQGSAALVIDLSIFFSGASSYSIAEALPPGASLIGSLLTLSTDTVGVYGPFSVTGMSATNSASLDSFTFTVTAIPVISNELPARPFITLRQFLLNQ